MGSKDANELVEKEFEKKMKGKEFVRVENYEGDTYLYIGIREIFLGKLDKDEKRYLKSNIKQELRKLVDEVIGEYENKPFDGSVYGGIGLQTQIDRNNLRKEQRQMAKGLLG